MISHIKKDISLMVLMTIKRINIINKTSILSIVNRFKLYNAL